ncbi:PIN domain-containing protein [Marinobacter nauticus]|uniref:PIN domain-containing protein n=1 Tax=Marinobacter nauticus TaxID=2743 RepID=UPI0018E01FD5|nr:PIN domain-containing protein [Marinobacter nauticus]
MIWLSVNRDFFICRSFCDHCKSLYSKPRLFSGGITKPINLVVIQLKATQANNLDFHLAYYLGKFDAEAGRSVAFEVVSNDAGFSPLIAHIKTLGRSCKQLRVAGTSSGTQTCSGIVNLAT